MPSDTAVANVVPPSSAASQTAASPSQSDAAAKAMARSVYLQAFAAVKRGGRQAAAGEIQSQGLDAETAAKIVDNIDSFQTQFRSAYRHAGLKSAGIGALWCVGGIVVTAVTYAAASGGGTYFVAWGAVLFGFIQAIRGLIYSAKQPSEADLIRAFNL